MYFLVPQNSLMFLEKNLKKLLVLELQRLRLLQKYLIELLKKKVTIKTLNLNTLMF